jgi:hypothetical protein
MTNDEARQAFLEQRPIAFNCHCSGTIIRYDRISEYVCKITEAGERQLACTLTNYGGNHIVTVRPGDIELYDPEKPLDNEHYFISKKEN